MKINLRGSKVAIEKNKKAQKGSGNQPLFVTPDSEEYSGIIRFLGKDASEDLRVGQKVVFTTNLQTVRMGGVDLCVVEDKEIIAILSE